MFFNHHSPRVFASEAQQSISPARHCERSAAIYAVGSHGLPRFARRDEEGIVFASAARQSMTYSRRMQPAIYILASQARGTLYVGVTSDLVQRVWQHKNHLTPGFTQQYGVHTLVYFELHATMVDAITREKQLKAGSRAKKVSLIEAMNPHWADLYPGLL